LRACTVTVTVTVVAARAVPGQWSPTIIYRSIIINDAQMVRVTIKSNYD